MPVVLGAAKASVIRQLFQQVDRKESNDFALNNLNQKKKPMHKNHHQDLI